MTKRPSSSSLSIRLLDILCFSTSIILSQFSIMFMSLPSSLSIKTIYCPTRRTSSPLWISSSRCSGHTRVRGDATYFDATPFKSTSQMISESHDTLATVRLRAATSRTFFGGGVYSAWYSCQTTLADDSGLLRSQILVTGSSPSLADCLIWLRAFL